MSQIYVVDDDNFMLSFVEETLKPYGHVVHGYSNAPALIEQLARDGVVPDLVITDVLLPTIDGFGLCEMLRAREATKRVPIIVMTGITTGGGVEERMRLQYGITAVLQKPLRAEALMRAVELMLGPQSLPLPPPEEAFRPMITRRVILFGAASSWAEKMQHAMGYFERTSIAVTLCRRWHDLCSEVVGAPPDTSVIILAEPSRAKTMLDEITSLTKRTQASFFLLDGSHLQRIGSEQAQRWELQTGAELYFRFGELLDLPVRMYDRISVVLPVSLTVEGAHDADMTDLGIGGARLVTPRKTDLHAQLRLRFTLPQTGDAVAERATVRWVVELPDQDFLIGVSFDFLSPESQSALKKFLQVMLQS